MHGPDAALFRWINRWPEGLAPTMDFLSNSLDHPATKVVIGLFLLYMLVRNVATRRGIVQALVAFPLANEITDVFKDAWPKMRPFQEFPTEVILRAGASENMGTASAHAANNAAIAFVLCYHFGWRGAPWAILAFLVGLSRVYNGVHYPWQVLLGWACGAFAGFVVVKTWEAFVRWRTRRREESNGPPNAELA